MYKKLFLLASFVLMLGSTVTSAAHPSPVAWWKFDGDALDSSGNGLDGTLMGNPAPAFVAGMFDQALDTTEPSGPGYVEITGYKGILGGNPFSITAWINTSSVTGTLIGWGSTAGGVTRFEFRPWEDRLRAESSGNVQGDTTLPDNEWIHVAVTVTENAIINDPDVLLYLNGEVDNRTSTGGGASLQMAAGFDVTIGRRHSSSARWFDALIDDLRLYDVELTQKQVQEAMAGIGPVSPLASYPHPENEATDVRREVVLSWEPGQFAPPVSGHTLYFSENFNDVNDGVGGITQDVNSYAPPQRLEFGTTYYWRIDEVNGPPDYTVYRGDVWNFMTEPVGYAIENIIPTASSSAADRGVENTVNGSGLDESGLLHSSVGDLNMWLSDAAGPQPTWIQYEFDKVYSLHEMWVWNANESMEPVIGFGFKDVVIEYSTNGTDYMTLGTTHEFARGTGMPDYAHNTTVDFGGVGAKYVRLTANSNWGGILPQFGLSEVRFFYIPVQAREPNPPDGATDVSIGTLSEPVDVVLGFRAGRQAATHDVYLSTDEQAVLDGTADVTTVTETSYGPLDLDLGTTYYWRVDEVNETETPTTWQGDIWDFTVQEYFVVDDFESYNELDPADPNSNRIFLTWLD
ncbi:MAG: LamG-like jellyroll fold domain-containing protein, partial [Planctomycetota bacterium]